jgi:hypothetical protein
MDLTIEANTMAILVLFIFSMLVTVLLSSKRVGQWIEKGKQVLQPSL